MKPTEAVIAAVDTGAAPGYPRCAPFHPGSAYAEYSFGESASEPNAAYLAVRECFRLAELDKENFGTPAWNPLRAMISPGETVLLKPNLIKERHPRDPEGWQYVLTHGSIVRAVADYVWKAVGERGKILVADAPQTDSSFDKIVKVLGLDAIRDFYCKRGLDFRLIDLRREEWINQGGVIQSRRALPGDPSGCVSFDLRESSEFCGHPGGGRYYGADYDEAEVNHHHTAGRHEYLIAGLAVRCDVLFNLPKLKTHKKAGITVALKNLVGITGDKNWLPHHTEGYPGNGGDEHPSPDTKHRIERLAAQWLRRFALRMPGFGTWLHRQGRLVGRRVFGDTEEVIRSGNWSGNDTVWRMCLDLNKIIMYGNPDGTMRPAGADNRKRHYVLVDGIIAGEGRGPLNPDPVHAGIVLFGVNPATVDAAAAYVMGFDPGRIPIIRESFRCKGYSLAEWDWTDIRMISNLTRWAGRLVDIADQTTLHFKPHFGWEGRIERVQGSSPAPELERVARTG